jgi:hypothetical protein
MYDIVKNRAKYKKPVDNIYIATASILRCAHFSIYISSFSAGCWEEQRQRGSIIYTAHQVYFYKFSGHVYIFHGPASLYISLFSLSLSSILYSTRIIDSSHNSPSFILGLLRIHIVMHFANRFLF